MSLLDYTVLNPAINTTAFPGTPSAYFWQSTALLGASPGSELVVDFGIGEVFPVGTGAMFFIRCVR